MDHVERALRDLLTDARLDVPVQPDAVAAVRAGVRRRRRTRAVAVAAAAVAVVTVAIAVPLAVRGSGTSTGSAPLTQGTAYDVGWIPAAAPTRAWVPPMTKVSPPPMTAPPCRADQLRFARAVDNGASQMQFVVASFKNVSPTACLFVGAPRRVTANGPGLPTLTATRGLDLPDSGVGGDLAPGARGYLTFEVHDGCANRSARYRSATVTLPSGSSLTIPFHVRVPCPGLQFGGLGIPWPQPHEQVDPRSKLRVSIAAPPSVAAGTTLDYVVTLTNPGATAVPLTHCPGYLESLDSVNGLRIKFGYGLNCTAHPTIEPGTSVRYEMRIEVPSVMAGDPVRLNWTLGVPDVGSVSTALQVR